MKDSKGKREEFIERIRNDILTEVEKRGLNSLSSILEEVRVRYIQGIKNYGVDDPEQSWKPFKGNVLEDIILSYIIKKTEEAGLKVVKGKDLDKRSDEKLGDCLSMVKRSLAINYGEFGLHLPDADLVIYDPKTCKAIIIISSKTTLRERVAQTAYWSLKLKQSNLTKDIKVVFITLDEDEDLRTKTPAKKGRAIAEVDIDYTYVITDSNIDESEHVKKIDKFFDDLRKILKFSLQS
ncbi:MAG: BsaWI family type II restriction enzyme [Candidatus Kryptonium sp.]|nr:BsaWI family type II restriction enzyme [Candidatus Kryptonium sp.]